MRRLLESIDPANEIVLPSDHEWDQMFQEIVSSERTRRRASRRPLLLVALLGAIAIGLLLLTSALAGDRTIDIHAAEALRDPEGLERRLAREGIDAEIQVAPSDDLAGKWFHLYMHPGAELDDETHWLLQSYVGHIHAGYESVMERCPLGGCSRTDLLELPVKVKGPMTLVVAREPAPGEEYWAKHIDWTNELAPTGAFYCERLEEKGPAEVEELLTALGYDVVWVHDTADTGEEVAFPPAGAEITFAFFRDADTVDVRTAAPEDVERFSANAGTPSEQHPRLSATWAPAC